MNKKKQVYVYDFEEMAFLIEGASLESFQINVN